MEFGTEFLLSSLRNRVTLNKVTSREVTVVGLRPLCHLVHLLKEVILCFMASLNQFHLEWIWVPGTLCWLSQIWRLRYCNRTVLSTWCVGKWCLLLIFRISAQIQPSCLSVDWSSFRNKMCHGTEAAVLALYELEPAVNITVQHSYSVFRSKLKDLLQLPAGQHGTPFIWGEKGGPSLCMVQWHNGKGFGEASLAMLMTYIQ